MVICAVMGFGEDWRHLSPSERTKIKRRRLACTAHGEVRGAPLQRARIGITPSTRKLSRLADESLA